MQEYDDLLHEFMFAVKKAYGEKVLIQVTLGFKTLNYLQGFCGIKKLKYA
jgi:hypothetical protein